MDGRIATGQLSSAGDSVTFINTATYALPETGGTGTGLYTVAGMLLIAIALVWGFGQKSKRERRLE